MTAKKPEELPLLTAPKMPPVRDMIAKDLEGIADHLNDIVGRIVDKSLLVADAKWRTGIATTGMDPDPATDQSLRLMQQYTVFNQLSDTLVKTYLDVEKGLMNLLELETVVDMLTVGRIANLEDYTNQMSQLTMKNAPDYEEAMEGLEVTSKPLNDALVRLGQAAERMQDLPTEDDKFAYSLAQFTTGLKARMAAAKQKKLDENKPVIELA